jgi:hypothetical protein
VGATHSKSSASQSQLRNHQLLSNGSVNTYPQRWNPWIYNLLLGKPYNNTCFPSGPTQGYITGDHTKWDWWKTVADVVHLCTFCIWNIKDLYEEVNRGYLFTLWHNLRRWRHDTHTILGWISITHSSDDLHCVRTLGLRNRAVPSTSMFVLEFEVQIALVSHHKRATYIEGAQEQSALKSIWINEKEVTQIGMKLCNEEFSNLCFFFMFTYSVFRE